MRCRARHWQWQAQSPNSGHWQDWHPAGGPSIIVAAATVGRYGIAGGARAQAARPGPGRAASQNRGPVRVPIAPAATAAAAAAAAHDES